MTHCMDHCMTPLHVYHCMMIGTAITLIMLIVASTVIREIEVDEDGDGGAPPPAGKEGGDLLRTSSSHREFKPVRSRTHHIIKKYPLYTLYTPFIHPLYHMYTYDTLYTYIHTYIYVMYTPNTPLNTL